MAIWDQAETNTRNMQLSWLLMLPGFPDPQIPLCISPSFFLFRSVTLRWAPQPGRAQPCIIQQKTNPLDQTQPSFSSRPPSPGAMVRCWGPLRRWAGCDLANPPTKPSVLPSDTSQPVLTFSLFKRCWTLLALDGGGCSDNDMPYATLPLQLRAMHGSAQAQIYLKFNSIILIWAKRPLSKSGNVEWTGVTGERCIPSIEAH